MKDPRSKENNSDDVHQAHDDDDASQIPPPLSGNEEDLDDAPIKTPPMQQQQSNNSSSCRPEPCVSNSNMDINADDSDAAAAATSESPGLRQTNTTKGQFPQVETSPTNTAAKPGMKKGLRNNNHKKKMTTAAAAMDIQHTSTQSGVDYSSVTTATITTTTPGATTKLGAFHQNWPTGLSFDCSDQLCGCCWCPCPDSNYSRYCKTHPWLQDDEEWPGEFPTSVNGSNAITINIRTDNDPDEISFTWSTQDDSGSWEVLESGSPAYRNSLNSYTMEVESDSIYKLQIFDSYGDGVCCESGVGWFTITNATSSQAHANGTVIWDAAGDAFDNSLEIFIWIDAHGHAQLVEYIPGDGYALQGGQVIVVPEIVGLLDEPPKPVHEGKWPGYFPSTTTGSNAITLNILTDEYPEETSFEWSTMDESGSWEFLESGSPANEKSLHSYTMKVVSNSLYRLQLFDSEGDGTCCFHGSGWFTITNSSPSNNHVNGTVIWEANGDALGYSLDVFIWTDSTGHAHHVEYIPDVGYTLIVEQVVVVPEIVNSSSSEIMEDPMKPFHDEEWPGQFPSPANGFYAIAINIRTDGFPEDTSFSWSVLDESGLWQVMQSGIYQTTEANSLHSYTIEVKSDSLYRLQVLDSWGDGTCCEHGFGWFTITNSTPSEYHANGTVLWGASGDAFEDSMDVFLWIDATGYAHHVECTIENEHTLTCHSTGQ